MSDIPIAFHLFALVLTFLQFTVQDGLVDVTERYEARALGITESTNVSLAASAKADDCKADVAVCAGGTGLGRGLALAPSLGILSGAQRRQEAVLYDFLFRAYTSRLARKERVAV